ncbi:MAG: PHP domain-containing protein [Clostridia bacterium]|nr:PHP domain-containing protein [Clostridia bacterium]
MKITGDYHTHTKYSKNNHGKNTIAEMVAEAKKKGLEAYGISDHGPRHFLYGIKRKNLQKARKEIDALKSEFDGRLYFSVEANLIGKDGKIDLTDEEIKGLDHLLVGYHRGTINNIVNPFRKLFNPEKQKQINTQAYLNLLDRYPVTVITHLNTYIKVDLEKVLKKAEEKGTLIEINSKHVNFEDSEAPVLIASGCKFIISSDAHRKENIANVTKVLDFVKRNKIPLDRIVNIDKLYK